MRFNAFINSRPLLAKHSRRLTGQNAAKQKCMMKKLHSRIQSSEIIPLPAFPIAGNKLFSSIGAAVAYSRGNPLSNVTFARIMGSSESTANYWFDGSKQSHAVALFSLLEHLNLEERHRAVDKLCRQLPRLDHPWLRHHIDRVGELTNLLHQDTGFTLIVGGDARQRTFLLTAFGHTFCRVDPRHRSPVGLDVHEPSWFVPVETLSYLRNSHQPAKTREAIRQIWPSLRASEIPLLLLNGIWSLVPELQKEIVALACHRHVIVAEEKVPSIPQSALVAGQPAHLLKVSTLRDHAHCIAVAVDLL